MELLMTQEKFDELVERKKGFEEERGNLIAEDGNVTVEIETSEENRIVTVDFEPKIQNLNYRIAALDRMLNQFKIVKRDEKIKVVQILSEVDVLTDNGLEKVVIDGEMNLDNERISITTLSALGSGIMKQDVGFEGEFDIKGKTTKYKILSIDGRTEPLTKSL